MQKFLWKASFAAVGIATLLSPLASSASQLTQAQVDAIIGLLQSFGADASVVANVQASLTGGTPTGTAGAWCHTFNTNLGVGKTGAEVKALHSALEKEGIVVNYTAGVLGPAAEASVENVSTFGEYTAAAVVEFQEKYKNEILTPSGLKNGTGYVGKATRAKLNQLYGCGQGDTITKVQLYGLYPGRTEDGEDYHYSRIDGKNFDPTKNFVTLTPKDPNLIPAYSLQSIALPSYAQGTVINATLDSSQFSYGSCRFPGGLCQGNITNVPAGDYYVSVRKGDCSGSDCESNKVLVTIKSPLGGTISSLKVLSPNGGETLTKGTTQTIKWQDNTPYPACPVGAACMPQPVKYYDIKLVSYYPPCAGNMCPAMPYMAPYTIAKGVYGSLYPWPVGQVIPSVTPQQGGTTNSTVPDGSYTVQVCVSGSNVCDSSDSYFRITSQPQTSPQPSSITVLSPNGGEVWQVGSTYTIRWNPGSNTGGSVSISVFDYSKPQGDRNFTPYTIADNAPNSGSYNWIVPATLSGTNYKIYIGGYLYTNAGVTDDQSDAPFNIIVQ